MYRAKIDTNHTSDVASALFTLFVPPSKAHHLPPQLSYERWVSSNLFQENYKNF